MSKVFQQKLDTKIDSSKAENFKNQLFIAR